MNKYQKARQAKIEQYRANMGRDCGAYGRITELECCSANSHKTRVALNGENDTYINFGSAHAHVAAESKTNGGRIAALYAADAPKFVIYHMNTIIKHKAGKHTPEYEELRYVEKVVIPTALFLSKLEEFGAIKSTNGKNPEPAIQVSSKKWYQWLCEYPVEYHAEWVYTAEDFEGLE